MSTYHERKKERAARFASSIKGWKLVPCGACAGSRYYDTQRNGRTPSCCACRGTGKMRVSPDEYRLYLEEKERSKAAQAEHERAISRDPGCRGIIRADRDFREGLRVHRTEVHKEDIAFAHTDKQRAEYFKFYNEEMRLKLSRDWDKSYDAEHLQPLRGA